MHGLVDRILLLGYCQKEVVTDRYPDLCVDRVLRSSIERLDVEMLLYPFKFRK